jgi:ATP synthase protein I
VTEVARLPFGSVRDLPYADGVPAAPDGPSLSGPMPPTQATSVVLRGAIVVTSIVGVLAVVIAGVLRGSNAALGAGLGAVIVVAFFAAGQWAVGRVLAKSPETALAAGMLVYLTQIFVLFILIALLKDATWLDPKSFASTIVVCTFVWIAVQIWGSSRLKTLVVEPRVETTTVTGADQVIGRESDQ